MKSLLLIGTILCVASICYGHLSKTKTFYCPVTFGVNAGVESTFNFTEGSISPGANYVQDNVTCYTDQNFTKPSFSIYTVCPQLIGIPDSLCVNSAVFLDGSGRLISIGRFFDAIVPNELDVVGGSRKYAGITGIMEATEDRRDLLSIFTFIYKLDRRVFK